MKPVSGGVRICLVAGSSSILSTGRAETLQSQLIKVLYEHKCLPLALFKRVVELTRTLYFQYFF